MINVAVLGYGVVGTGVVRILMENEDVVAKNAGQPVSVKHILVRRDFPDSPVKNLMTKDFNDILNDADVDVVVEVMGGVDAAYAYVKAALESGKSAVTSNKALVAAKGPELIRIAREKNVNFMFEASVGGGIPIIRPLTKCLTADRILEITGILNGTTNYILTKMYNEGLDFATCLAEAQKLGYAEADPTADVEGYDPSRKIAILASLANGRFVDFEDIPCTGITKITDADIAFAKYLGKKIKLFASCRMEDGKVFAEVAPCMAGPENPLYAVDDVMNAILVKGNMLGNVCFSGPGAGSLPTASAVVSDIVVAARHLHENIPAEMAPEKIVLADSSEAKGRYYIRMPEDAEVTVKAEAEIQLPAYKGVKAVITGEITKAEAAAQGMAIRLA